MDKAYRLFALLGAWLLCAQLWAGQVQEERRLQDDFVRASLVRFSPDEPLYSVFGHLALRMECPSEGLDFCFDLEMDASPKDVGRFLSGASRARVLAVPTDEYLSAYAKAGRGAQAWELALTPREKQRLWRHLDEGVSQGANRRFNLLTSNCTSFCVEEISRALEDEHVVFDSLPPVLDQSDGTLLRHYSAAVPWAQFVFLTICGSQADRREALEHRLSPQMAVSLLKQAWLVSDDGKTRRKVFCGSEETLLTQQNVLKVSPLTPTAVFGLLLVLVVGLTLAEQKWQLWRMGAALDAVLFGLQALVGTVLLYMALASNVFGARWNWYLIPLNPLPLLLWLRYRHCHFFTRARIIYGVVLVAFVLSTPLSSQLDLPHALIVAALAVRCFSQSVKSTTINQQTV